jgi:adenylate cyclase
LFQFEGVWNGDWRRCRRALDDMGEQAPKNIAEPMRAWRVRLGGNAPAAAPVKSSPGSASPLALPDKPSIAVLPFQNMSGDSEQEHFADGMVRTSSPGYRDRRRRW